ncbi:MAG: ABC transporter permease [Desulfobacteraceae bacterium]|nr:ABC transporter permease [Desulfobacteraceae bacterium]MBC2754900.1 ABC transporter permease [Desulfobacteraceae bacterium]
MNSQNITVISSKNRIPFRRYLSPSHLVKQIFRYRQLLGQSILWEINDRYRGSALGILWAGIIPLVRLAVFTLIFSMLLGGKKVVWGLDSDLEVGMMILCGFILFNIFAESIGKAPRLMWINKTYVKNIAFPIEIIPLIGIGVAVVHSMIGMGILIVLELFKSGSVSWTIIFLPLLYLPLVFFVAGISWIIAALGVFYRDVNNLIQSLIQVFFLLSAVIFPLKRFTEALSDQLEWVLRLNLLATIIENARRVFMEGHPPDWFWLNITFISSIGVMMLGYAVFMYYKREFADVI